MNGVFDLYFGQSWMLVTFAGEQYERNLDWLAHPVYDERASTSSRTTRT